MNRIGIDVGVLCHRVGLANGFRLINSTINPQVRITCFTLGLALLGPVAQRDSQRG